MSNKTFKIMALIGIIGNIGVGLVYLIQQHWAQAAIHVSSGVIFIPMYINSKEYVDED